MKKVNLRHLVESKWKIGDADQYWSKIRRNKPNWKWWKIVDIRLNVRFAHISVRTIRDNADRIKESGKYLDDIKCEQSETRTVCLCSKTTTVVSEWTVPKIMDVSFLYFYCIINK